MFAVPLGHGALAPKDDLPIPETWFAWGAAIVLILSFIGLSIAWVKPRFEEDRWKAFGGFSRVLVNRATEVLAGALGVFLLGVVIWSGLYGTANERANFSVTFVFVTFWVCVPIVSILLGDVFRAVNPWRAIGRVFGGLFGLIAGRNAPAPLAYPDKLGRWPAVAGLGLFLWLELAYGVPFEPVVIIKPHDVAVAALIYSGITFVGMALFGVEKWCERGETFGVLFNMFSRISPLEVRDGSLGRRPWLSGGVGWSLVPGSVALVLLLIAGTTYDGAAEGVLAEPIDWFYELVNGGAGAEGDVLARRVTATVFMLLTFGVVSGIYWGGIKGMGTEGSGLRRPASSAAPSPFASSRLPSHTRWPTTSRLSSSRSRLSSPICSRTRWERGRTSSAQRTGPSIWAWSAPSSSGTSRSELSWWGTWRRSPWGTTRRSRSTRI